MKNTFNFVSPKVDQVGIIERSKKFTTRSIKAKSKIHALKLALSMIDLTTLEGKDTNGKVKQLCEKAKNPHVFMDVPTVAAICVYPNMVKTAKASLVNTNIKVASVSTSFPSGMNSLKVKREDVRYAIGEGADEIDMVISRGKFLEGDYQYVFDEIAAIKELCGKVQLKVILETGELGSLDNIRLASDIALHAGADFIKTSTGKISTAATMPITLCMLEAIRDFYKATGIKSGMKPAGGISDAKLAIHYLVMVKETLGKDWLTNKRFRFGASRLANDILLQLRKQETGIYQSSIYFSND